MPGDKYCLSWGGHEKNLSKVFCDLRRDEDFCDVAIACEDLQFQAHKVVLSASSEFFNNILKKHSHPYPLLYLSGVKARDMKLLLDFMYSGEVTVKVDHLQSFIAAAEEFKVQGLNNNQSQELQSIKLLNLSVQPPRTSTQATSSIYKDDPIEDMATSVDENICPVPEPLPANPALKQLADEFWDELICPPAPPEVPRSTTLFTEAAVKTVKTPLLTEATVKTESNQEPCWLHLTSPGSGRNLFKVTQKIRDDILSMEEAEAVVVKEWKDLRKFVVISKRGNLKTEERRTYQCTICGFCDKGSAVQVQNHVEGAHFKGTLKYSCAPCGKQFGTREYYNKHMRKEHNSSKKPKESVQISAIVQPSEVKMDPNEVKEWEDLKGFIAFKEMGKRGRGGKLSKLECTICGRTDWRRGHLMNHVEQKHFRKKFVYSCTVCGARPSTKHALECHMRERHKQ